jgi:ATP-dependent DNA helicase RecG
VYIICPLVEDSDFLGAKSVEAEYARLQTTIFKHRRIGLLHGRMKPAEKDQIMLDYKAGKYDILVSTTVVEVGVDVPNASVIMIEAAETIWPSAVAPIERQGRP